VASGARSPPQTRELARGGRTSQSGTALRRFFSASVERDHACFRITKNAAHHHLRAKTGEQYASPSHGAKIALPFKCMTNSTPGRNAESLGHARLSLPFSSQSHLHECTKNQFVFKNFEPVLRLALLT
jgi:hypothetical protein